MATSLLCDQPNCSQTASAFGFLDSKKSKVCRAHITTLTNQHIPVFDIASYDIVQNPGQTPGSEDSTSTTPLEMKIKTDLDQLESRLQAAKACMISAVERNFRVIEERAFQRYEATQQELIEIVY